VALSEGGRDAVSVRLGVVVGVRLGETEPLQANDRLCDPDDDWDSVGDGDPGLGLCE